MIAYIWRMNRIKIKLASKKRALEEAKKNKKPVKSKYGYNSTSKLATVYNYL